MELSIIIPFLNEASCLPLLLERLGRFRDLEPALAFEVVLVDDGSTDASVSVLEKMDASTRFPVRLVELSRNFGSHAAISAGARNSRGKALVFLSADLQDPPELVIDLLRRWREGHDVVWATRISRDDPFHVIFFSRIYYFLLRKLALPQMPEGGVDLCLVDRAVIEALSHLEEKNSNIFNLILWAGYRQCVVPYERAARSAGQSKWTWSKKAKLFIDSFVAFSYVPIRLMSLIGIGFAFLGLFYAAIVAGRRILLATAVEGWSSLMVVVLIVGGIQMMMLGVVSEYLWRSLEFGRGRPTYLLRRVRDLSHTTQEEA